MAVIVNRAEVIVDKEYEQNMEHDFGVTDQTCGSRQITVSRGFLYPGKSTRPHYHYNAELCEYILSGRGKKVVWDADSNRYEYDVGPGDFIYTPRGEIHQMINLSQTETLELIAIYGGANSGGATGKVYVVLADRQKD